MFSDLYAIWYSICEICLRLRLRGLDIRQTIYLISCCSSKEYTILLSLQLVFLVPPRNVCHPVCKLACNAASSAGDRNRSLVSFVGTLNCILDNRWRISYLKRFTHRQLNGGLAISLAASLPKLASIYTYAFWYTFVCTIVYDSFR